MRRSAWVQDLARSAEHRDVRTPRACHTDHGGEVSDRLGRKPAAPERDVGMRGSSTLAPPIVDDRLDSIV